MCIKKSPRNPLQKSLDLLIKTFVEVTKNNKEKKYFEIYTDMTGNKQFYENIKNDKNGLRETINATFSGTIKRFNQIAQENNYPHPIKITIYIKKTIPAQKIIESIDEFTMELLKQDLKIGKGKNGNFYFFRGNKTHLSTKKAWKILGEQGKIVSISKSGFFEIMDEIPSEVPHSRYLLTNSFDFCLDEGFHFFNNESDEYVRRHKVTNETASVTPREFLGECKNAKDLVKKIEGEYNP